MQNLSIGKIRNLQQCTTPHGAIAILALDHRNNLRQALNPAQPQAVSESEMVHFKQDVVGMVAPAASAVLLDPEFGAAQCIASGALPGRAGLLCAVEASGYGGEPTARSSQILPGWSIAKAARMGANAIKLLVYYHPHSPTAGEIESLVQQVAEDCASQDLPLFVEPLSYSLDPSVKQLPSAERRQVVIETAHRLTVLPMDVLKAEFPLDIATEPDQSVWAEACAELSKASRTPWVLLSATVGYEDYLRQVAIACQQGASGVAVGRAVWKEAPLLKGQERADFLLQTARHRMERVTALCDALARPWTTYYQAAPPPADWYKSYA